jgi:hypothetical protein
MNRVRKFTIAVAFGAMALLSVMPAAAKVNEYEGQHRSAHRAGDPTQWLQGDPSQWGLDGDPTQWLQGDPSQWGLDGDPTQWLQGDPSQWG